MPGLHGTGPNGNGPVRGWRFGRCRNVPVIAEEISAPSSPAHMDNLPTNSQDFTWDIPVYGRGRGGVPFGYGRGFGYGSGKRLQR